METGLKGIIRVLVVEDSPSVCKVLTDVLGSRPEILVVGVAYNGKEAVEAVSRLKPDIITMDMHMPIMDGLEATKQIMAYNPTPILIVSASTLKIEMDKIFEAISYGALDVIEKGRRELIEDKKSREELIEKIKFLSGIKVIRHPLAKLERGITQKPLEVPKSNVLNRIAAIVTSTGGPAALLQILKSFPKEFPCSIVIVQHITAGFIGGLVDWLNSECQITIKVGDDSEKIRPGVAYIAPSELQMRLGEDRKIHLSNEPPYNGHRPSGDLLLESVAKSYGEGSIGVILTGMGRDGAMGIKAIKQLHGQTIAQDEASCVVFGMPKAAIEMNVVDKVLPLEKVAEEIVRALG